MLRDCLNTAIAGDAVVRGSGYRKVDTIEAERYVLPMVVRSLVCRFLREMAFSHRTMAVSAMLVAMLPRITMAQEPVARGAVSASVSGVVFDSLAQKPLGSAVVELVKADSLSAPARSVQSDSLGNFRIEGVRPGRYLIGFMHPMLDSIGIERPPREVTVDGVAASVRIDLALPSPRSLRLALCGASAVADSIALIMGIVRDAGTRAAVASSTVTVEWADFIISTGGLRRTTERRTYTTEETGWFALCGAPVSGSIELSASHDADSTAALELEVPGNGLLRRDLFFGVAREMAADVVPRVTDSLAMPRGPRRAGDGRLTGTVVASDGGRPLAGARISIRNGPSSSADERGAFTLTGIPTGTRMLDVRAVAYAPAELPVDVVEGGAPLRIELATLKSVLDTVKVRANLSVNRDYEGFLRRQKHGGAGRFIATEEIARRNPIFAVDMLRSMPGILIVRDDNQYDILAQRSPQNFFTPFCRVAVFVNGNPLREPTVNDLNAYLRPHQMLGVEVYDAGAAPAEFSRRNGCGVVVVWTK